MSAADLISVITWAVLTTAIAFALINIGVEIGLAPDGIR